MITATDEHRAEVLRAYRQRRVMYAETPHQAMSALSDVMAHAAMLSLAEGRQPVPSLIGWWLAARTYVAAMQGRGAWWYENRQVNRRCTSVPSVTV